MDKTKVIAELKKIQGICQDTSGIETEEATKHSLILPLLIALGYNVFDNNEVRPEYVADVGTKKGEKVDYVIIQNGQPTILLEAKQVGTPLNNKVVDQLFRYFSVTSAKIAILTDGVKYMFFTDSQKANIMDTEAYMIIDIKTASDEDLSRLASYHKEQMHLGDVLDNIKYELFREISKKFVDNLIEMRPDNWLIKKLAEECEIAEPDDVKLAEILNNQVSYRIDKRNKRTTSSKTTISNKELKMPTPVKDIEESKSRYPMGTPVADIDIKNVGKNKKVITDSIFKNTKGLTVTGLIVNGERVESERMSWKEIYTYLFMRSIEGRSNEDVYRIYNKGGARAYLFKSNCTEYIKEKSFYIEDRDMYLYKNLSGSDSVKRAIDTCDIFGAIDKNKVEIEFEI